MGGQNWNVIHGNVIEVAVDRQIAGTVVVGQANRAEGSGVDHLSQSKIRNTNRNVLVVAIGYHHSGLILNSNRVAAGEEPVDLKEEVGVDLVDINIGSYIIVVEGCYLNKNSQGRHPSSLLYLHLKEDLSIWLQKTILNRFCCPIIYC